MVGDTFKKRNVIITAAMSISIKISHTYGIELPYVVKETYEIDRKHGNTFWRDVIEKEMHVIGTALEILENNEFVPKDHKKVTDHVIFDIKMDFTRKTRWVLHDHKTPSPECSTHARVVSRKSVRITLTYGALNDVDIFAGDIISAYLQAPTSEKH